MADSFLGGLLTGLNDTANNMAVSPLFNMGLGLMSAAKPFGNVGDSLMQANRATLDNQAAAQNLGMNKLQMQMMMQRMKMQAPIMNYLGSRFSGQPAPGAVSGPSAPQGIALDQSQQQSPPAGLMGMSPQDHMTMGAMMGMVGLPGSKEMMDLGEKLGFQYNPAYQAQAKAAESPISVDQLQIQNALQGGNGTLAMQLYQKMQKDLGALNISDRNGAITRVDPNGQTTSVLPQEGLQVVGNQASLLPGMARALQTKGAAESLGRAAGETAEVTDAAGNKYTIPKTALLSGQGGVNGMPPLGDIGPGRKAMLTDQSQTATQTFKESQAQADASNLQLAQIGDLRQAAHDFTPGKFAESRGEMLQYLASSGLISDNQKNSLGSYQAGQKISIQLQSAATKALGSREAAQVFGAMGKSIPNLTMSQDGLEKVSAFMEGMARYNIARAQTIQDRFNKGDANGVNSVKDEYYQKTNPMFYILASASPETRAQMLKSSPNPSKLMTDWVKAYKQGMAPTPAGFQ